MRKRSVLLVILGLTACICWAIGSAVADQPINRAASSGDAQPAVSAAKPLVGQTSDKPVTSSTKAMPDTQAPAHVGGAMPVTAGSSGNLSPKGLTGTSNTGLPKANLDPSRIHAVPANVERHTQVVDAAAGADGSPRDAAGVCLPAGGVCGPVVYKNMEQEHFNYYYDSTTDAGGNMDDVWLAGTDRDLCSITVESMSPDGTYSFALEIWTDCPYTVGAEKLYGPYNSGTLPAALNDTVITLPGVTVPTFFYIKTVYTNITSTQAGPIIAELAEIGFTEDSIIVFAGTPLACSSVWFGGGPTVNPWSGWAYQISAAGTAVGKCCYNNCAACADTTYSNCMARAGNPEFLLGTTCAEAPACGKGACCLTTGACVANKTQAECQATPNYLSWQLGSDCTAHGQIPQADCAPAPSNDLCANAIPLSGTCLTVAFNNRNATMTAIVDDPPTCLQDPADPNNNVLVANDIWYTYQIPSTYDGNAVTSAKVVINTLGSKYDSFLAVYAKNFAASPAYACGNANAIACVDVSNSNLVGCNDDIVGLPTTTYDPLHEQIQASLVTVTCDGATGPLPGGCLLIRVSGLAQIGNLGGAGVLNIDFIPTGPQPTFYSSNGVCCLPNGTCVLKNSVTDCTALLGFFRPDTDFYENGNPAAGFEASAPGCCHGEFSSCQVGEYCGKPIVINPGVLDWAGSVHKVTYFKFTARDFRAGDPGYPGADPHYALTIDTCGSDFDTVLSVYKGPFSSFPFTDAGDCDDPGAVIVRNDDCSLDTPGAEGRVTCASLEATTSCVCLSVGSDETNYNLMAGNEYYIAVGKKDARLSPQRAMGIDPVPNYPVDSAATLAVHIKDGWENCSACTKQCCKGDLDGNGALDALDIAGFVNVLCAATPLSCQDATWCRANMNGDSLVDLGDIPAFVSALLVPWPCDLATYCSVEGYCQLPDVAAPSGGIISDMNTNSLTKIADNFVSLEGGQITRVCWWGMNLFNSGSWGTCTVAIPADNFAIRFYSNVDNRPGSVIASYSGITLGAAPYNLTKAATGRTLLGASENKYEVQIPPVAVRAGECVWMEIVNNTGSVSCNWLWETITATTTIGDLKAATWEYGYYRTIADTDLAFCVNIPLWGKGCDPICTVTCPAGGVAEGEPVCGPGYVDAYNAGCNMAPGTEVFSTISSGQTICGKSGVYDSVTPGFVERDTDWYKLVLTGTADWHVTLTGKAEFTMVLGLLQYAQNSGSGNCADLSGYISPVEVGRCTNLILDTWLAPGTWYIFVAPDFDDPFYPDCGADYTLKLVTAPCPTYTNCLTPAAQPERCPGGTGHTAESETCGQKTNNGCNAPDPNTPVYSYGTITGGSKVCGTVYADAGTRDTDWYQFTLTQTKLVKATLKSEFPGIVMLLKVNNCVGTDVDILSTAYSTACSSATAQETLDAGTYVVFVSAGTSTGSIFNCVKCTDTWNDYDLHLVYDVPVVCTQPTYCQDWHNSPTILNAAKAGTTQYKVADNFVLTGTGVKSITHVCWWGAGAVNSGSWAPCTLGTLNINLAFHTNVTGDIPNTTPITTRIVGNAIGVPTGGSWNTNYPIYLWQADITAVNLTAGTRYWMSIWDQQTTAQACWFMVMANANGAGGDDVGAQWNGTTWAKGGYDLAICLNAACDPNVFNNKPANDTCAGATTLTFPLTNLAGDLTWATGGDLPQVATCGVPQAGIPGKSVWYKFTAPANGSVTIGVCTSVAPLVDTVMALFSGTCGALTEIVCDDDGCSGASPYYSKIVRTGLTPGTVYYVEVGTHYYYSSTPGPIKVSTTSP